MPQRHLLSLLVFSVLILAFGQVARAQAVPKQPYTATCQGAHMQGTTLLATCKDYFGNLVPAALPDADSCKDPKAPFHIAGSPAMIQNVNGALRCVVWSDPIWGLVSVPSHQKDDRTETTVWRIDQPEVMGPGPYDYSTAGIKIKSGDMLSINAGGCVQTGGMGATWKSYTNPSGDDADHLYSGTIAIPGVIGDTLVRIGGVLAPMEWHVPRDLPPTVAPKLDIGYQDDGYSDNGYYAHDDGNNNQCANVGPAWIEVKIVSDLTPPKNLPEYSPHSKDFDLTWDMKDGVDANGLPLAPTWAYEIAHPGKLPDFKNICGSAFSTSGVGGTDTNVDEGKLASTCSSQAPVTDLCTEGGLMFFGYCPANVFHGHLNWSIATYTGNIAWEAYSGNWPNDHDYNFWLTTKDSPAETEGETGLGLEFDGEETLDYFSNPWWNNVIGTRDDSKIGAAINGHFAVATGLVGIDGVHGDGHTESHPVYSLAIRLSQSQQGDTIDETWVYFLRNSGTEGNCSHMTHAWPGQLGVYYLPFPWPSAHVKSMKVSDSHFWKDQNQAISAGHGMYEGWAYLKFQIPDSDSVVDGQITLRYTVTSGTGPEKKDVAASNVKREEDAGDGPGWDNVAARFKDPTIRKQFMADLLKANPAVKVTIPKRVLVNVDPSVKEHTPPAVAGHRGEMTRDRVGEDPRKKAEGDALKPLADKYQKDFPKLEVR